MLLNCPKACGLCPPPDQRERFWLDMQAPAKHMEYQAAITGHLQRRTAGECVVDAQGPWVYEVCPGASIKQFRPSDGRDPDNGVEQRLLGRFNWQASLASSRQVTVLPFQGREGWPVKHRAIVHVYTWGSECPEGSPSHIERSADLYMACRSELVSDAVPSVSVTSHGPCHSSVTILTQHLCEIPGMALAL